MRTLFVMLLSALMSVVAAASVHDYTQLPSIDGKVLNLSAFKGKIILIVNTASKCGYTKQYAELQQLADLYKDKLVVVGFPANNFMGQEPGSNEEILEFCQKNYGVTFPLSEKISVKGKGIHPLFKYLTSASNPDFTGDIRWNFEKFLIDENGNLVHRFRSAVTPLSKDITQYLK